MKIARRPELMKLLTSNGNRSWRVFQFGTIGGSQRDFSRRDWTNFKIHQFQSSIIKGYQRPWSWSDLTH
jgi:hypothetical protein